MASKTLIHARGPIEEPTMIDDGYLSKDRAYLARMQRARRARMVRVDYMPNRDALAIIAAMRATQQPGSVAATNSAVLDAIVTEWASLTGIKWDEIENPMTSANGPGLGDQYAQARMTPVPQHSARAQDFGGLPGINAGIAGVRAGAYESDWLAWRKAEQERRTATQRVTCGARRHRDGQPCQALSEPGKRRCRFHGGRSTGPRTDAGKARALANLRTGRNRKA